MKKQLIYIALLFGAMLIAGTIDESTRQLEQQPNHTTK
jgi:PBP1b-binding outer membrane lipoprotein LpoB